MSDEEKSGAGVAGGCIGQAGNVFLEAWVLMLVLGGIHHGVSGHVPAVGYWPALCLVIGVNMLTSYVRKFRK